MERANELQKKFILFNVYTFFLLIKVIHVYETTS